MTQSTVAICLLARNVSQGLAELARRLENMGERFSDYRIIVVENDSNDGTDESLVEWARLNPRVRVDSRQLGLPSWPRVPLPARARQLADLRNRYLDLLPDLDLEIDYVLVMDGDLSRGVSPRGLASSFGYEDWDVMTSNGLAGIDADGGGQPMYFDAWAYRETTSRAPDDFSAINALSFQPGMPPIPVHSAFGGLAIYRVEAMLNGARYAGGDCEHVMFHAALRARGYRRIYLNPSQVVLY